MSWFSGVLRLGRPPNRTTRRLRLRCRNYWIERRMQWFPSKAGAIIDEWPATRRWKGRVGRLRLLFNGWCVYVDCWAFVVLRRRPRRVGILSALVFNIGVWHIDRLLLRCVWRRRSQPTALRVVIGLGLREGEIGCPHKEKESCEFLHHLFLLFRYFCSLERTFSLLLRELCFSIFSLPCLRCGVYGLLFFFFLSSPRREFAFGNFGLLLEGTVWSLSLEGVERERKR